LRGFASQLWPVPTKKSVLIRTPRGLACPDLYSPKPELDGELRFMGPRPSLSHACFGGHRTRRARSELFASVSQQRFTTQTGLLVVTPTSLEASPYELVVLDWGKHHPRRACWPFRANRAIPRPRATIRMRGRGNSVRLFPIIWKVLLKGEHGAEMRDLRQNAALRQRHQPRQ